MNINMIAKVVFVAVLSLLVNACSSQSAIKANYYLLNEAHTQPSNNAAESIFDEDTSHNITLSKIRLSDYLRQPNIAMQLQDHQLYYSNNHLWAEPLESAIANSLLKDLNQGSSNQQFVAYNSPVNSQSSAKLTIEIEHFIATVDSKVILSGQFWMIENAKKDAKVTKNVKRNFTYSLPLEKDGYPHAVFRMRQLLTILSTQIANLSKEQFDQ